MWWVILALIGGMLGVYLALRLYINAVLTKEAQFASILNKLQREAEAIITEFNRITDRNVTIAEEKSMELAKLIEQGRRHLIQLSKKKPHSDEPVRLYSPHSVAKNSTADHPAPDFDTAVRDQIARLLRDKVNAGEIAARVGVSVSEVEMVSAMLLE